MDEISQKLAEYGSTFNNEVASTLGKLYHQQLEGNNDKFNTSVKTDKGLKYASHERNRLDVYSPISDTGTGTGTGKSEKRPVIVYIHGGGLLVGDNDMTPNIYSNIGNYLTSHNTITVLATYRLINQGGRHPSGAEDVRDILKWVQANIAQYGGDRDHVYAVGQSAGGFIIGTALFSGMLDEPGLVRGVVFASAVFDLDAGSPERRAQLAGWFGTDDVGTFRKFSPLGIFQDQYGRRGDGDDAKKMDRKVTVPMLVLMAENELGEVVESTLKLARDYYQRFDKVLDMQVMLGHNHVSYCFGTGLGGPLYDDFGKRILEFVRVNSSEIK